MSHSRASQRRVIVLGASNVVIGMAIVMETACRTLGRPLEILAAIGHGRSFGRTTRVLGRTLPGILECDLWSDWEGLRSKPTTALLTDVGNDLMYGSSPDEVAEWVRSCLKKLRNSCEHIILTELPLESAATVGPRRFLLFRSLFFPGSRVTWQETLANAQQLNAHLLELSREFQAHVVHPPGAWYGFDPIHIHRRHRSQAWRTIMSSGMPGDETSHASASFRESLAFWNARPKFRRLFGVEQRHDQPALNLADGTTVSLY